jgi:hypothetical protein
MILEKIFFSLVFFYTIKNLKKMASQQDIIVDSLVVNGPICAESLKINGEIKAKDLTNCCTMGYYQSPIDFLYESPLCLDDHVDDYLYEGENCRLQQIGWDDCIDPEYAFVVKTYRRGYASSTR